MDHSHHGMSGMSSTSTASSAAGTPASDMSGMSSSMHMSMSMGTFHWSSSGDGIWLDSWVPQSEGAYIGACFGLFFCALLSRSLPALEAYFIAWKKMREDKVYEAQSLTRNTHKAIRTDIEKTSSTYDDTTSFSRSFNQAAYPAPPRLPAVPPFSLTNDTIRSFLATLSSFVGYLLMMVVMTGNGGFFLVIVLGIFFGELAFGRFRSLSGLIDDHHSH
ncbi:MAG: Ctr copper transporter family-domain-containing protein [Benjaminiella poitrasii]|nr:MAG: Ctr copper transporter family-domain-containing protein [Benjaminiella poitrasii]